MEDILSQALTSILVNLQHQYANDPNALLYFCINQSHMVGGIRSSVHSLNFNRPDQMVKQFMADFYHYINSNADVKLDDTFECYFHIVSSNTLNKPGHRRTAIPIRSLVGSNNCDTKPLLKGSLINLPQGSPESPCCFKNACLLVTVVFMIIKKLQPDLYPLVRDLILVRPKQTAKNRAAAILLNEVKKVCLETGLNFDGPHELLPTLKLLSEKYNVNLIVIASLEGSKPEIINCPQEFNDSVPRLYFLLKLNDNEPNHVYAIDNLSTFFKTNKRAICFKCNKFYRVTWGVGKNRHKCHHPSTCRKCFGFTFNELTLKDHCEPWWYCNSSLESSVDNQINKICSKCGTIFTSLACYENHFKYYCKTNNYFYVCPCCQKSVSMRKRSLQQVQNEHICGIDDKFCRVCNLTLPLNHICAVSKKAKDKMWPNLAVISIAFEDAIGSLCQICYMNQSKFMLEKNLTYAQFFKMPEYQELLCNAHKASKISSPNVIKIFYENDRFSFRGRTFSNNDFLASVTNLDETLLYTYSTSFEAKNNTQAPRSNYSSSKNLKLARDQFLYFIKSMQLANYTFVVYSNREMLWLLDTFLSDFLNPTVVQTGRVVKKIALPGLKINFLLFENYCKGSLQQLSNQFNLNRSVFYFPMVYNQSKYYHEIIQLPTFETFLTFNDTSDEVLLKQNYYTKLSERFDVNVELYKVITENLKTFLLSVLKFVDCSFNVQACLAFISNSKEPAACHPFGEQVVSLSGFAMAVYKYYFYNFYDGRSVVKPYTGFSSKVSVPEYEYMSFLAYTKPSENIVHAFNRREGQVSFDKYIVDGYSLESKTVHQFHGCMVSTITRPYLKILLK